MLRYKRNSLFLIITFNPIRVIKELFLLLYNFSVFCDWSPSLNLKINWLDYKKLANEFKTFVRFVLAKRKFQKIIE